MKIQYLAVIFIIIILPISVILSAYTQNQVKTLTLQISYDGKLIDSTYDAVKAFQLNTIHNTSSDLAGSKIKELEASANTFFNSISNNFNMVGYNNETLQEYVPALVYTLYDGFYIYSSFTNEIDVTTKDGSAYKEGQTEKGLLPYVYYSCEYKNHPQSGDDFVITYSLDNYIRIQGKVNGKYINEAGYYITGIEISSDGYKYNGCTFRQDDENLNIENVGINTNNGTTNGKTDMKYYIKVNGKKYYKKDDKWIYYDYSNENIQTTFTEVIDKNKSAYLFYKEAYEFTDWIYKEVNLGDLSSKHAVNEEKFTEYNIFQDNDSASPNSDFNQHKLEVIKYTIERNLAAAIANFNSYSEAGTDFQMPKLTDVDWEKILGKVSVISFLQGLNIGGKIYNGYAIVGNNKTDEFVADDSIYIASGDFNAGNIENYYRVTDPSLYNEANKYTGYFNTDFERKKRSCEGTTIWFYQRPEYGSYTSIVNNFTKSDEDIYTYVKNLEGSNPNNAQIKKAYFTALARERYSMYKTDRDVTKLFKDLGLTV